MDKTSDIEINIHKRGSGDQCQILSFGCSFSSFRGNQMHSTSGCTAFVARQTVEKLECNQLLLMLADAMVEHVWNKLYNRKEERDGLKVS